MKISWLFLSAIGMEAIGIIALVVFKIVLPAIHRRRLRAVGQEVTE